MNDRHHGAADHARHDQLLVSRFGATDAYPTEIAEAEQLVRRCAHCAQLARDINALRSATSQLPAARRTRDFRLTEQQAESLRGSTLQRWLRRLAAPGLAPVRPLAGVAVSIGLVLVVAGVALPTPGGDVMGMLESDVPSRQTDSGIGAPGATYPAEFIPATPLGAGGQPDLTPGSEEITDDLRATDLQAEIAAAESTRSLLIYGGLLIALASFAMLSLIVIARRRGTDPLLR